MSELPKGWVNTNISEIVMPFDTIDPGAWPEQEFTYVDIGSIDNQAQRISNPKILLGKDAPSRARRKIKGSDILFSTVRTYLKNIAIVPETLDGSVTSTGIAVLRPSGAVLSEYLFNYVRSPEFLARIGTAMDGTLYPAIRDSDVLNEKIPLPPLQEQNRIVTRLDSLFTRTRHASEELAKIPILVELYKEVLLTAAFEGRLTACWRSKNGEKSAWTKKRLGDIASVGTGATPKRGTPKYYDNGTIPWVTSSAVNLRIVNEAQEYITEAALKETNCKIYPAGTILMAMYGEGKTRGRVSMLGVDAATNQALAAIQIIDEAAINRDYLVSYLNSLYLAIREKAAGGVQPNLNLRIVSSITIPVPTQEEQAEIVKIISKAFLWLDSVLAEAKSALNLIKLLDNATLSKAFTGELVLQDTNDEPASVLLERINAARTSERAQLKRRRKSNIAIESEA